MDTVQHTVTQRKAKQDWSLALGICVHQCPSVVLFRMETKERQRFLAQIPKNRVLFQRIVCFSLLRERLRNAAISSDMRHGSVVVKLESFLRLKRFSAGFSIMHTLHLAGQT